MKNHEIFDNNSYLIHAWSVSESKNTESKSHCNQIENRKDFASYKKFQQYKNSYSLIL